ncbi:MAG: formate--tetrahydrofolate ligase [Acidobacteria bacterium]|nr:MAG: formate--tetrahydrofolate ligase [Acidobacteriota bacterium]
MLPIAQVGHRKLGINLSDLLLYGHFKAKVSLDYLNTLKTRPNTKLILITAITPTAAGEGKTTTTVGLGDALNRIGKPAIVCLREPSLGPCFGVKGGATGGGYAQVLPMEDINLHFTGDFHAIGAANNLLAALVDNHIYWGNSLGLDARRISWRRAVDMNDRSLRQITIALGGIGNGFPREDGWDIIAASEIMAVFCLAENIDDLKRRLGNMIVGQTRDRKYIRASDFEASGAMTALLKDAFAPNLVQTIENNPALIHGGPFANIAHGCNSVIATKSALKLADYVVTEAGFGADLGAEKFMNIKCRKAGLRPDCAVVVATIRALKMHGGMSKDTLKQENLPALEKGFDNLARHVENVRKFGVPVVVAVNRFTADTEAENVRLKSLCDKLEVECITADHWAKGGEGAIELAETVVRTIETKPSQFRPLYPDDMPLWKKAQTIAREMYGADEIIGDQKIRDRFRELQDQGYGHFPVCIAKTQYSFTTDPDRKGAPKHHVVPIREVRLSAGAEFIVAICGDIMTMPGLPKIPAANKIDVTPDGRIVGLF